MFRKTSRYEIIILLLLFIVVQVEDDDKISFLTVDEKIKRVMPVEKAEILEWALLALQYNNHKVNSLKKIYTQLELLSKAPFGHVKLQNLTLKTRLARNTAITTKGNYIPFMNISVGSYVRKPCIVVVGGAYGSDWLTVTAAMNLINEFVLNYYRHSKTLEKVTWIIIPVLNPDGYNETLSNKKMSNWKKNMAQPKNNTDKTTTVEGTTEGGTTAESKTEESKTEESKTEESKTEESKTEESKTEESKTEESKTEESKTEESKTEESKTEESKTEESKTEESKTEESKTEESKTEESKTEESKTKKRRRDAPNYINTEKTIAGPYKSKPKKNCFGVNLRLNFEYQWIGYNYTTASWCDEDFADKPFSQNESAALRDTIRDNLDTVKIFLTVRQLRRAFTYPFRYTSKKPLFHEVFEKIVKQAAEAAHNVHGREFNYGHILKFERKSAGDMDDWIKAHFDVNLAFTCFISDWNDNKRRLSTNEIKRTNEEALAAFIVFGIKGVEFDEVKALSSSIDIHMTLINRPFVSFVAIIILFIKTTYS